MSEPKTQGELRQAALTMGAAGPTENLVSTECPVCHIRFAMVARLAGSETGPAWKLRCTMCGAQRDGELEMRRFLRQWGQWLRFRTRVKVEWGDMRQTRPLYTVQRGDRADAPSYRP